MGLFKNIFENSGEKDKSLKIAWKQLTDLNQLESIVRESAEKPVVIFKHSTRCGISQMTLKKFESEYALEDKVAPYFLDLLNHRDISNAIAQQFNVEHQSPQLLLIADGKCIYDASHGDIDAEILAGKV